jgi:ribosome biogenesis protein ERB1
MRGHKGQVRSISVEPEFGQLLVSGGADLTVRVWSLPNGNCLRKYQMSAPVTCVQFCPDPKKSLVLVCLIFLIKIFI